LEQEVEPVVLVVLAVLYRVRGEQYSKEGAVQIAILAVDV
jgi:hypothetical protein